MDGHNILESTVGVIFFNSGLKNDPTKLSFIQWIRIFGKVLVELACNKRSTPIPCPLCMDMSRSII